MTKTNVIQSTTTGESDMQPLKIITQTAAIIGLALTGYAFTTDACSALETLALAVFFFWAHVYAHAEIKL